ncbi:MAG: ABC transporter substrate-binding protein [Anaerolineae bacterium]|nr:MAG: ABC transporter substrate-binding protein [Anaerolineae bacterium]
MRLRKYWPIISIVFVLIFLISACAQETATQEPAVSPPEPTKEIVVAEPEEPEESLEPIPINFWNYWDGKNGEVMQALIDEYNSANPDVEVTNIFIGWGELLPKLQTAAAGGDTPDIAAVDLVWMPKMVETGILAELNEYLDSSGVDLDDFYNFQLNVDRYGDTYYGLPVSTNNLELFYNKDLFEAAGLDPDVAPTSWEELMAFAEQCANPEEGISGMELFTEPGEGLSWQYQVYLWQAGGDFLSEDLSSSAFNSPAGEQALQFWVDLIDGPAPLTSWGLFGQGKSCMVMDGSWMVGIWADGAPFEWGTASMPFPSDGEPATNMGGEHLIIFKADPAKQQAAWDFANWLTSVETQIKWDKETGFMPIRESVATDPDYLSWLESTEPRLIPFVESQQYAHNRPPVSNYPELSDAFSRELEKALLGAASVTEALEDAEAAVNNLLAP